MLNRPPERSSNMSHNDSMLMWNLNNYEVDIDEGLTSYNKESDYYNNLNKRKAEIIIKDETEEDIIQNDQEQPDELASDSNSEQVIDDSDFIKDNYGHERIFQTRNASMYPETSSFEF